MEALAPMFEAVNWPHESLKDSHEDGVTEPWIAEIIASIIKARGADQVVLETGGFKGITSAWIALALEKAGGGVLNVTEIEAERVQLIHNRIKELPLYRTSVGVQCCDVLAWINYTPAQTIDVAWIDDDHQKHHVEQEIVALWPKMKPGGIMLFHDVWGSTDLQTVVKKYGGVSLDLPRLGPAGGLGVISIPRG